MCQGTMHAVVLKHSCKPEDMHLSEVPIPHIKPGWVLVKVKAFGLNRSELMLREYEVDESYIKKPIIPGIECAGIIAESGDSRFHKGERVVALMGGMGRDFDGSYAEYALLPEKHVFSIESSCPIDTPWYEIASVPETWFTAWGSLFVNLRIQKGQTLLIRGGTSSLGLASLQLAKAQGCRITSTTRKEKRVSELRKIGADEALIDDGTLVQQAKVDQPDGYDCILELIGPKTLEESFSLASVSSQVCMTGILSKPHTINNFDPIKDIPNGVSLSGFYSNYPDQKTINEIFSFINIHNIHPYIAKRYSLDQIGQAHSDMEQSRLFGKAIVEV